MGRRKNSNLNNGVPLVGKFYLELKEINGINVITQK